MIVCTAEVDADGQMVRVSLVLSLILAMVAGSCNSLLRSAEPTTANPLTTPSTFSQNWERAYRRNPFNRDIALAYARELADAGKVGESAIVLARYQEIHTDDGEAAFELSWALMRLGNSVDALKVLELAYDRKHPSTYVLRGLGVVNDRLGRHRIAQDFYTAALKLNPDDSSLINNYAISAGLSDRFPLAERLLRRAASRYQENKEIQGNLALIVGLQRKFKEFLRISGMTSTKSQARKNLAIIQQQLKTLPARIILANLVGVRRSSAVPSENSIPRASARSTRRSSNVRPKISKSTQKRRKEPEVALPHDIDLRR